MTFAVNVLGWVGVVALLSAYWLVSTQKAMGDSRTYQGMNLLGAILVLVNSSYYGRTHRLASTPRGSRSASTRWRRVSQRYAGGTLNRTGADE